MEHSLEAYLERRSDEELMMIISDTDTAFSAREEALQILSKRRQPPLEQTEK